MGTPFKMKGAGEVYYEGNGDAINLNPNDLIEAKGDEEFDDYGNKQYIHKETQDIFYKNKPVLEPKPIYTRPIKQERSST